MSTALRPLVTAAALVVLAGCSAAGTPGGTPPGAPILPARPAAAPADGIPPCSLLAPDQADRLGLRRPSPGQANVEGLPSPGCTWLGSDVDVNVQFIPVGAEVATALPGATVTQVNGFGAVRNVPDLPGSPPICQIAIDVAPSQTIRVQAGAVPNPPYGTDELCRRADEAASMVMTTVVATTSR